MSNIGPFEIHEDTGILVPKKVPTKEQKAEIALKLFRRILCQVSWEDCKVHTGGIALPGSRFDQDIEEAARAYKELGGSWEEWT